MPFLIVKKQGIGRLLNLSLAAALLVLVGLFIKRHYTNTRPPIIGPSAKIAIEGVDLSKSSQTLLVAVAKDCEYCTGSARFYRWLVQGLSGRDDIKIVALFPDSLAEGQRYLKSLGIAIDESRQASLPSLGIRSVPTLALLDRNGVVKNVWIGKLPPKKEAEVMQTLGMKDARPSTDWVIDENEFRRRLKAGEELILVDLRDRDAYARNHLPDAKNIPFDELNARAKNELSGSATVVLYSDDDAIADFSYMVLSRQEFPRILILDKSKA